jgi:hypothetical protein
MKQAAASSDNELVSKPSSNHLSCERDHEERQKDGFFVDVVREHEKG